MRVVQLLPAMQVGGVERGVAELSAALSANGVDSIVVSRGGALVAPVIAAGGRHIDFSCGGKNPLTLPARVLRLRRILAELAPDIVHVRSRVPAWLLAFSGAHRYKIISTFHGIYHVGRYSEQMTRADMIICPSHAVREHIMRHYRVPEDKLPIIPRGVDWEYFAPEKTDADAVHALREQLQLAGHTVFLLAGRLTAIKGHALFINALAKIRQQGLSPPPLGLIVGDNHERRRHRLQALAAEQGVADALRFAGVIQNMREVYAVSDVVVSASLQPEAFGRTVTEALAMQRAAVAPAFGGALDIIRDGENGVLFAPGDSAALAAAMPRAVLLPRAELRESVAQFTLSRMVQETMALYSRLLAR